MASLQQFRPMRPYLAAFLALGVGLSFFGPALPTLRDQTGATLGQLGLVFAAQSVGGLVGSVVAGRLYRRLGGPHLIAVAVCVLAASIALLAVAGELALVIALGALMGLGAGTMDVSANTVAPTLVAPEDLVSSMNALHMCFAIGALGTPLVVGASTSLTGGLGLACGVFGIALVALGVTLWRRDRADGARRAAEQEDESGPTPATWRLAIVATFFLLYVGLEVCFAGWIATYADELHLGSGWGTAFTATFWGGFLVGRLLMTWRGERVETGRVLWASVILATVIAVLIALVGAAPVAIVVGAAAFGAAIAPQFPTMLAHLHRVVPLTGTVTAWCIAGSAVGGLILPPVIGTLFDSVGAAALPWTVAAASVLSAVVLFATDRYALVFDPVHAPGADAVPA
jgi:MFS transporter, FHS family, Na+ dependent glucose transporter 1